MAAAGSTHPLLVLVPGAWMGSWIWDDTISRLESRGIDSVSITLEGLAADLHDGDRSAVTLADHVRHLREHVEDRGRPVVLVGHSYSGLVVGHVADQLGDAVSRSVHISSFLPRDGRSLIDDWGPDQQARDEERRDIQADGMLWVPPPRTALAHEVALTDQQRRWLSQRLVPHPGRTVLDPAEMSAPVTAQPVTFVSSVSPGSDPLADLPPELIGHRPDHWDLLTMDGGHWPMLSEPDTLAALLAAVV